MKPDGGFNQAFTELMEATIVKTGATCKCGGTITVGGGLMLCDRCKYRACIQIEIDDSCPGIDDLDPSPEPRTAPPRLKRYEGSLLADCEAVQPAPKAESVMDAFNRIIVSK